MTREIFFLKNHVQNKVEKLFPDPFLKKIELSIYLDQQSKVLYSLFLLHVSVEGYRNILTLSCRPLAFTSHKASLKNKMKCGTSLLASFSA